MSQSLKDHEKPPQHLKTSHMPAPPALVVSSHLTSKPVRQKYTDHPLQLLPSSTTAPPALAVRPRSPSSGSEDGGVKLPTSSRPASRALAVSSTPAMAVLSSTAQENKDRCMQLLTLTRPATPALAVSSTPALAVRPSTPMSPALSAETQLTRKIHEYRTVRRESRNAPPAIVNPSAPHCYYFNRWEHCYDAGFQCGAPECDRTIGSGTLFLLQCERCKLCACQRHQRKATTHSTQHQWGMTKEHNRKTSL